MGREIGTRRRKAVIEIAIEAMATVDTTDHPSITARTTTTRTTILRSVLLRSCSLLRIERQLLFWVLSSEGDRHVSRHNPYHYPHSCLARRLSNLGPQQRLGVWAFWNCRPHSHRGHHLGSAGSAVISFSEAQLSAAGFQAYRAEGCLPPQSRH